MRKLYQPLWLMGNTSIAYCRDHGKGDDNPFAVVFDPAEVREGLDIPPEDIHILEDNIFPGLAEPDPSRVICFPFAQHYIADSPGCSTSVQDQNDLISKYNKLGETAGLKTFSYKTILRQIGISIVVGMALVILLSLIF